MHDEIYQKMYEVEHRHWWFSAKREIILSLAERYMPAGGGRRRKVADLGCGCGRTLQALASRFDAVGLDSSATAIEFCRARGVDARLGSLPDDVPFAPASFDAVVLADVLEHIEDDTAAAVAAAELLTPGGVMVASAPALPRLWSQWDRMHGHKRRYTRGTLKNTLAETGLEREMLSYCNTLLLAPAVCLRILSGGSPAAARAQLEPPWRPVNALLRSIFAAERHLLGRVPLPIGLSLVAVMRKPLSPGVSQLVGDVQEQVERIPDKHA